MSDGLNLVALANELEALISTVVPAAKTVSKYGGTLFTLKPEEKEGQFCGVFVYKEHVQLSFSRGSELADPQKLLSGSGKHRRHINFVKPDQIMFSALEKLLTQASEL